MTWLYVRIRNRTSKNSPDYLGKPTQLTLNQTDNYCIACSVVGITFYLSNFIILILETVTVTLAVTCPIQIFIISELNFASNC